uniref:Uncharacterized protein n=1 Tax=Salinispora arenicola (strain CNS-205) TaxID=391037 RepID=A8M8K6_SALAI
MTTSCASTARSMRVRRSEPFMALPLHQVRGGGHPPYELGREAVAVAGGEAAWAAEVAVPHHRIGWSVRSRDGRVWSGIAGARACV